MSSFDVLEEQWDKDFDKIEEDYDKFSAYFDKHRKCACVDVNDCRHFDRALKIFDKKLDALDDLQLKMDGIRYEEIIKPALEALEAENG